MSNEVIEASDEPVQEANVQQETPEPEKVETPQAEEQPQETPTEPTFEIEGQQLTQSQIKEALEAAKNKAEWQKSNTQKAQEIAEERRRIEAERQELLLGKEVSARLKARPELAQAFFAPEPQRDLAVEYQRLMSERPADIFSQEYVNWELRKDQLNREIIKTETIRETQGQVARVQAESRNQEIERDAIAKYVTAEKVNSDEFKEMVNWIADNIQTKNGSYPKNCFDMAYKMMFSDREVANTRLEVAKQAAKAIEKAKPASQSAGMNKQPESDLDETERDFVNEVRARSRK